MLISPNDSNCKCKTFFSYNVVCFHNFYFYDAKNEATVKAFIDYVLSDVGQKNVADAGYVPIK